MPEHYLICSEEETFTTTRQQAEGFLRNRIGFNEPALQIALNGVRDCNDFIILREGYVIRFDQTNHMLPEAFQC